MMRKSVLLLILFLCLNVSLVEGALYEVNALTKDQVSRLTDQKLLEKYIDVIVELEAATTFHQAGGFQPTDYKKYKDLIRFRIVLTAEIRKRKLPLPDSEYQEPEPLAEEETEEDETTTDQK